MSGAIIISSYFTFSLAAVLISKRKYRLRDTKGILFSKRSKMPYFYIVFSSLMFTVVDFLSTYGKGISDLGGDRKNYYRIFVGQLTGSQTYGLARIFDFVRLYSDDIRSAFYLTSFVCFFLLFLSYRISDDSTPSALAFVLLTDVAFAFYVNLKQAYAIALGYLMFSIALKKNTVPNTVLCLILSLLACLFHPSAIILVLSLLIIKLLPRGKQRIKRALFILVLSVLLVLLVFGDNSIKLLANFVGRFSPEYSNTIINYLGEQGGGINDSLSFSFIKGFPFYYLAFLGFVKRKYLKQKIKNYDAYWILTIICSVAYVASLYSYWLARLSPYFYLHSGIFFGLILKNSSGFHFDINGKKISVNSLIIYSSLFVLLLRYMLLVFYINYSGF